MGNACATSEDNGNASVSFRSNAREANGTSTGNDLPTQDIAVGGETVKMNPIAKKATMNVQANFKLDENLRDDPTTKDLPNSGPLKYGDGTTYQGQFKNGMRHGLGEQISPEGDRYVGNFAFDQKSGRGKEQMSNGDVFEGEFSSGLRNGQGTLREGDTKFGYTGQWRIGQREGHGVETCPDGTTYEGSWLYNKKNGKGKWTFPDKTFYEGNFVEDRIEGEGYFNYGNGKEYRGGFKNNMRHGFGRYNMGNGLVYEGNFVDGKISGEGTLTKEGVASYTGGFLNGEKHGVGVTTKLASGKKSKARWENGAKVENLPLE